MTDGKYFFQTPAALTENAYESDIPLRQLLRRVVPEKDLKQMEQDLIRFGSRVVGDVARLGEQAAAPENEPKLIQYNGWGHRVDEIKLAKEWKLLHDVAANEGLIAAGYDKKYGPYSRLFQMIKLYLFAPVSAIVTCPLSMTDGAARLLTQLKIAGKSDLDPRLEECLKHLVSRDPSEFWTSGQWMTERPGGSDVGNSETIARRNTKSSNSLDYLLTGYKFFTSATTADVTFTLARIEDEKGNVVQGSRGLSLFFVKVRNNEGKLNNIRVHRLKNKFGTKPLPTAELELMGVPAVLVGRVGEGVRTIALLFNITRIYTAMSSAAAMSRMLALSKDYAKKRSVFGGLLSEKPLHINTLANLEVTSRGILHLFVELIVLLGKSEHAQADSTYLSEEEIRRVEALLRLLTPLAKLYSAKLTVGYLSECIESFGGAGYMTDTGIPQALADAQVDTIWEGTTNVLSLDVLRAMSRDKELLQLYFSVIQSRLEKANQVKLPLIDEAVQIVQKGVSEIKNYLTTVSKLSPTLMEEKARLFSFTLARVYIASLLIDHAISTRDEIDIYVANQWCTSEPISVLPRKESLESRTSQLMHRMLFKAKL